MPGCLLFVLVPAYAKPKVGHAKSDGHRLVQGDRLRLILDF